jgi:hypothetical protein
MGLQPVFRLLALVYYEWAMSEIDPLHPDVPEIVLRLDELKRSAA